jgi:hypothetical protein
MPTKLRRSSPSRSTKKLPNSQRILQPVTSDNGERAVVFGRRLVHPVAPQLSVLAPLFGPFRSPVRGLPSAAVGRRESLIYRDVHSIVARPASGKWIICPVIRPKTGEKRMVPLGEPDSFCARHRFRII